MRIDLNQQSERRKLQICVTETVCDVRLAKVVWEVAALVVGHISSAGDDAAEDRDPQRLHGQGPRMWIHQKHQHTAGQQSVCRDTEAQGEVRRQQQGVEEKQFELGDGERQRLGDIVVVELEQRFVGQRGGITADPAQAAEEDKIRELWIDKWRIADSAQANIRQRHRRRRSG